MEPQYLALMQKIMSSGSDRGDRTGTGTRSVFGEQLRCDLREGFPLLTTKRLPFRHLLAELLWFISGSTDVSVLQRSGVKIWNDNSSAEFLAKRSLPWAAGDIGPGYGFQWRHYGAEYTGCTADYTGKGTDQLAGVIRSLREDPYSRRHFLTAWNPAQVDMMALPPCHLSVQFYINGDGNLCAQMYQRSADAFLGLPWNIASYALLTHIIAELIGRGVGELILCLGDVHIYKNHFEQVREQLTRAARPLPKIAVECGADATIDTIGENCITLSGYDPHPAIAAKMAV